MLRSLPRALIALSILSGCAGSAPAVADDVPAADAGVSDDRSNPISDVSRDVPRIDSPVADDVSVDAGAPDTGALQVDAGAPMVDVGAPMVDVGAPDTGAPAVDVPAADTPSVNTFLPSYPLTARFPEGGTYDPRSHRFFVGSLGDGTVRSVHGTTGVEQLVFRETAPGRWWTLGMDVDVARRRLAVCAMDDRRTLGDSNHPYDGYVWVFDIDTGARVARYPLSGAFARATCTDVAFSADGGLYVCDREHPRIYRIDPSGALTTFVTNSLLSGGVVGQNALVVLPDQSALLSLVYLPSRLVRVSLRDRSVANVTLRGTFFDGLPLLSGADGMTFSGGALLVAFTSQVTRVTPTLADWSAGTATTLDVPSGMTDMVHTPAGDFLLNGQAVTFGLSLTPTPFQLVRFVGVF